MMETRRSSSGPCLVPARRTILARVILAALALAGLPSYALDLSIAPHLQAGSGQAGGQLLASIGERYSELGASSVSSLGSYSALFPIALGGFGADLALSNGDSFLYRGPLSLVLGLDAEARGGAIKGSSASGTEFASARARSLSICLRAAERYSLPLGPGRASAELGPLVGLNVAYVVQEDISGVSSLALLAPRAVDLPFAGLSLGLGYGLGLGRGAARLGFRGDLCLTPLSSSGGALGARLERSWRAMLLLGYEIPLEPRKATK